MSELIALFALVRKEFIQALRDRQTLMMILVAPVIQMTLFGFAVNLELVTAQAVVVDQDQSLESRSLIRGFSADTSFPSRYVDTVSEGEDALREGKGRILIIIPHGFGRRIAAGEKTMVQALVDGSDPLQSIGSSSAIEQYVAKRSAEALVAELSSRSAAERPLALPGRVMVEARMFYNPALKSRLFMVPGTAASILVVITTIVTAMGLTREREAGTMEQLLVTPISPVTLMVGKTIPYGIFGLVDQALILVVGDLLFGVPMRGSVAVVFAGTVTYLLCTLGIGLFISTVARTQQQALMGGFFFLMPAILLSGFMTPIDAMPAWIQPLTWINPVRYYVDVIRSVLLRGSTLRDVLPQLGALLAIGVGVVALASIRFRRTLA